MGDSRANGAARARLRANIVANHPPCWLCGQPIDYSLPGTHPDGFSVDHVKGYATHRHLAEEPTNLAAAHLHCNQSRGTRAPRPGVTATSRSW
jgi:5-methylcytosine-specific restriction endonuclease McrA